VAPESGSRSSTKITRAGLPNSPHPLVRAGPYRSGFRRPGTRSPRLVPVTAAHDYDDLHHLVDRLSPRQAERLRVLVASDPELAPATQPEGHGAPRRHLSITGIWESGRGDLAERHDEIIRGRLKRPA
jgi:hypothetical protein